MAQTIGFELPRELVAIIDFVDWAIRSGDAGDRKIAAKMAGRWKAKNETLSAYYGLLLKACLADVSTAHAAEGM